jgi:hypothetical protein
MNGGDLAAVQGKGYEATRKSSLYDLARPKGDQLVKVSHR